MHPKNLSIADFTYALPEERIAKHPLSERDASQLLIYKSGSIQTDIYKNIAQYIPGGSTLFFNNTKVVAARLLFEKTTGSVIEIFCLEPHHAFNDMSVAMMQQGKVVWRCLVGGASKWKHGQILEKKISVGEKQIVLRATYLDKIEGSFIIELAWLPGQMSFAELLYHAGAIPLPPYIKREVEESDTYRYQTVYALTEGSVAAPTAGLHFSDNIFKTLEERTIKSAFVTLHVGAGTFKPVKSEIMAYHEMHSEFISVEKATIEYLINHIDENIIAVGTTSLRTIESLYWLGVKLASQPPLTNHEQSTPELLELDQWDAYEHLQPGIPVKEALENILTHLQQTNLTVLAARTRIIIAPGYRFKIIKALITNFHQPQSTLLLLIAAFIGDDWKKVYAYALENDFRFLSYGDGSLLWKNDVGGEMT